MSAVAAPARVGWCPGALRPMASGDGLIVRIKPRGGTLTPGQGIGIAGAAARFGNGALDLTSRANLQIRGVDEATLADLTAALDGLGLLDASAEAEARRNVVASPLAGLDPSAAFDIRPAVKALENRLAAKASLADLPAKFGFAVSDGGTWPLRGVPADVRFDACLDNAARPAFEARLDGDERLVAVCTASAMAETAVRLARAFVQARSRDPELDRMRDLVSRDGAGIVFDRAGLATCRRISAGPGSFVTDIVGPIMLRPRKMRPFSPPGRRWSEGPDEGSTEVPTDPSSVAARHLLPGGEKGGLFLGVAAPFGRLDATQLDVLARSADAAGVRELRLTPWRAVLVPGLDRETAARLAETSAAAGLIVDPADPRLRVAACAGEPGCRRGTVPTLDHAVRFARLVGPGQEIALHVSGCSKGCAHPGPAPLTLVGRNGRYDVVVDGRPGDAPTALGLDAEEARRLLRTLLRRDARP